MGKSINLYKSEFAINFARVMKKNISSWKKMQKIMRADVYGWKTLGLYCFVMLLCFLPGKNEHNYCWQFHAVIAVIVLIIAILAKIHITNKSYQNRIKKTLFPRLLKVFGDIKYYCPNRVNNKTNWMNNLVGNIFKDSDSGAVGKKISAVTGELGIDENFSRSQKQIETFKLESSGLIPTGKVTEREDDDCFWGKFGDVDFTMNESNMGYITYDKHNNEYFHSVFRGLILEFKMNKVINAPILIKSKSLTSGIGTLKGYERVKLESVTFDKKYDVWVREETGGQIEARYFLTSLMLDRFMNIQTSFRINKMSCSVQGNSLIIMLKTNRDLFEMNHLYGKIDEISQYKHLFDEMISILSFIEVLNLASRTGL